MSYIYGQKTKAMEHKNFEAALEKKFTTFLKRSIKQRSNNWEPKELTYNNFFSNKLLVINTIRTGIPYSLFVSIKAFAPFSDTDWAAFLNISPKSLHRYKLLSKQFKPAQSEKIIEMTELIKTGLDVFGNMDKFKLWLDTPNYSLGKLKPIELIKDSYGKELVLSELVRIDHGILV